MSGKRPTFICCDGPGSYGYEGHECQREGCGHFRIDHKADPDEPGAITGVCSKARCRCPEFVDLP